MENNFLLEFLAACHHDSNSKLVYVFHGEYSFVNYLDQTDNLTESLEFPILKKQNHFQTDPTYIFEYIYI